MRIYKIPFDVKHEEKIFGGYLSLRQVIYLALIILAFSIFLIKINFMLKLCIFITLALLFLSFTFISINETNLDKYCIYIIRYLFRKKKFKFVR